MAPLSHHGKMNAATRARRNHLKNRELADNYRRRHPPSPPDRKAGDRIRTDDVQLGKVSRVGSILLYNKDLRARRSRLARILARECVAWAAFPTRATTFARVTLFGIAEDKVRLLSGQATQRVEQHNIEIVEALKELREEKCALASGLLRLETDEEVT